MTNETYQKKVNLRASTHIKAEMREANVGDEVVCVITAATAVLSEPTCPVLAEQQ
jgi:ribosomal protein S17